MGIKIVTDSASDITPDEAAKMGISIVPLTLNWDGNEYRDSVDIGHKEFFSKLEKSDTVPTTSQVSPEEFERVFEKLTFHGDKVIVITISSALSGTYQSANIAAAEFEGNVFVVDSLSATVGQRLLVQTAIKYTERKMSPEEIVLRLNKDRTDIRVLAKIDTLEYLKKGGRISSAVAFAGGMLSIKPVITIDKEGAISLIGKARGSKNGNNLLRKFVEESGGIDFSKPYALVYSGVSDEQLNTYIDDSKDMWEGKTETLPVSTIGPVIGTHIGPGAIGIAFYIAD